MNGDAEKDYDQTGAVLHGNRETDSRADHEDGNADDARHGETSSQEKLKAETGVSYDEILRG